MSDGHPVEETVGERPPVVAAPPCVMVVFGAGGDLDAPQAGAGADQPAPRRPAAGPLRDGRGGPDRGRGDGLPRQAPRRGHRLPRSAVVARRARLVRHAPVAGARQPRRPGHLRAAERRARSARARPRAVLSRRAADAVRPDRQGARRGRAQPGHGPGFERAGLAADRRREAVRPRRRHGQGAQPGAGLGLQRAADLPHRPLPREGDRPEPDGLPLRQRHLRAGLEPPLHRPRADHRGRGGRRRRPRRLLRNGRRAARHGAEPPVPAAGADGDGTAQLVRAGPRPRRARQGAAGDPTVHTGDRRTRRRAWPVRGRRGRWGAGGGLSRRADGRPAIGDRDRTSR